jgi:hypothetical protein
VGVALGRGLVQQQQGGGDNFVGLLAGKQQAHRLADADGFGGDAGSD